MRLTGKTILIISSEAWGTNLVSKHHYAIHLSKNNNQVYFLNPPIKGRKTPQILDTENFPHLKQIFYSPLLPGLNRIPIFFRYFFQNLDIKRILKITGKRLDIVWSFDPYRFQNLKSFNAAISIFHPVDYFTSPLEFDIARHADVILSVSEVILDKYKNTGRTHFINHGLSNYFLTVPIKNKTDGIIRCGYVGNLLSFGLDKDILTQIVSENPTIEFHFIGPVMSSNLGTTDTSKENFLSLLKEKKNVFFYGSLPPEKVADLIQDFDFFLVCYKEMIQKVASNSHKILEYLSTGKVIVSTYISSYESMPNGLFEMVKKNNALPVLFGKVASNLNHYNTHGLMELRRNFALGNTYDKQIRKIESLLEMDAEKKH